MGRWTSTGWNLELGTEIITNQEAGRWDFQERPWIARESALSGEVGMQVEEGSRWPALHRRANLTRDR